MKAVLDDLVRLKELCRAPVAFLEVDGAEWYMVAKQLFGTDYEKHIVLLVGGFHLTKMVSSPTLWVAGGAVILYCC